MAKLEGEKIFSLLKLEGENGPVFFVIENEDGEHEDGTLQSDNKYFYEEHSCPTNWLRNCVAVIEGGDEDPHGFLMHVRSVKVRSDYDPNTENGWAIVFPEVSATETLEGEATDVSDQRALTNGTEPTPT